MHRTSLLHEWVASVLSALLLHERTQDKSEVAICTKRDWDLQVPTSAIPCNVNGSWNGILQLEERSSKPAHTQVE